jgi:MFS family permease
MMPGIAYYLSRWYRRSELAFRLSLYIVTAPLAGAFGGLLASGILKLSHFGGLHTWRMIFAIEGIITCCLAVISFFTLTDRPATAKWLTQEEKDLAIARVKSERVGTTEVLDKIDMPKLLRGIFSPVTLGTSFIFLLNNITVQALAFFAPTIVKTIYPHNSTISLQLHTVPPYVFGAFFVVFFSYLSSRYDRRNIFYIISAPLVMIGYIMFLASTAPKTRCKLLFPRAGCSPTQETKRSQVAIANKRNRCSYIPHCNGSIFIRCTLQRSSVCQRPLRYCSFRSYWHKRHVRQHWWPHLNMVLPTFRWSRLSHR